MHLIVTNGDLKWDIISVHYFINKFTQKYHEQVHTKSAGIYTSVF